MITPQRIDLADDGYSIVSIHEHNNNNGGRSGGGSTTTSSSSAKRVVRSALELLATNNTPQVIVPKTPSSLSPKHVENNNNFNNASVVLDAVDKCYFSQYAPSNKIKSPQQQQHQQQHHQQQQQQQQQQLSSSHLHQHHHKGRKRSKENDASVMEEEVFVTNVLDNKNNNNTNNGSFAPFTEVHTRTNRCRYDPPPPLLPAPTKVQTTSKTTNGRDGDGDVDNITSTDCPMSAVVFLSPPNPRRDRQLNGQKRNNNNSHEKEVKYEKNDINHNTNSKSNNNSNNKNKMSVVLNETPSSAVSSIENNVKQHRNAQDNNKNKPTASVAFEKVSKHLLSDFDDDDNYTLTSDEVEKMFSRRLQDYDRKRNAEEEKILTQLTNEIALLQEDNGNLEQQNSILTDHNNVLKNENKILRETNSAQAAENAKLIKAVSMLKNQCTDLTSVTTDLHAQHADAKKRITTITQELTEALNNAERTKELSCEEMKAVMEQSKKECKEIHLEEMNVLRQQLHQRSADLEDADKMLEQIHTEMEKLISEKGIVETKLGESEKKIDELQRTLSATKHKAIVSDSYKTAAEQSRREESKENIARIKQLEESCKLQTDELRKKMHKITMLEADKDEKRRKLEHAASDICRLQERLEAMQVTVQSLGSFMQNVLAATIDGSKYELEGAQKGRSSFVTSRQQSSLSVVARLTSGITGNNTAAAQPLRSSSAQSYRNADVDLVVDLSPCVAVANTIMQQLTQIQNALRQFSTIVPDEQSLRKTLEQKLTEIERENSALVEELNAAKAANETVTSQMCHKDASLDILEQRLSSANDEVTRLTKELEEGRVRHHALIRAQEETHSKVLTLMRSREEDGRLLQSEQERARGLERHVEQQAERNVALQREITENRNEVEKVTMKLDTQQNDYTKLSLQHEKLVKSLRKSGEEKEEIIQGKEKEVNMLQSKIRSLEAQVTGMRRKQRVREEDDGSSVTLDRRGVSSNSVSDKLRSSAEMHQQFLILKQQVSLLEEEKAALVTQNEDVMNRVLDASVTHEVEFLEWIMHSVRGLIIDQLGRIAEETYTLCPEADHATCTTSHLSDNSFWRATPGTSPSSLSVLSPYRATLFPSLTALENAAVQRSSVVSKAPPPPLLCDSRQLTSLSKENNRKNVVTVREHTKAIIIALLDDASHIVQNPLRHLLTVVVKQRDEIAFLEAESNVLRESEHEAVMQLQKEIRQSQSHIKQQQKQQAINNNNNSVSVSPRAIIRNSSYTNSSFALQRQSIVQGGATSLRMHNNNSFHNTHSAFGLYSATRALNVHADVEKSPSPRVIAAVSAAATDNKCNGNTTTTAMLFNCTNQSAPRTASSGNSSNGSKPIITSATTSISSSHSNHFVSHSPNQNQRFAALSESQSVDGNGVSPLRPPSLRCSSINIVGVDTRLMSTKASASMRSISAPQQSSRQQVRINDSNTNNRLELPQSVY